MKKLLPRLVWLTALTAMLALVMEMYAGIIIGASSTVTQVTYTHWFPLVIIPSVIFVVCSAALCAAYVLLVKPSFDDDGGDTPDVEDDDFWEVGVPVEEDRIAEEAREQNEAQAAGDTQPQPQATGAT